MYCRGKMAAIVYDYKTDDELGTVSDEAYMRYLRASVAKDADPPMGGSDWGFPSHLIYMRGDVLEDRAKREAPLREKAAALRRTLDGPHPDVSAADVEALVALVEKYLGVSS